eukprot:2606938-Ditylum_brightwellii.AAC.1
MMKSDNNSNKIQTDLTTLSDQIKLCQTMLGSTPPSQHQHNKALLAVVGLLKACVPQMVELVDTAAQGALSQESTLEQYLEVNDALLKVLENFDDPNYMGGVGWRRKRRDLLSPPIKGGGKSMGEEEPDDDAFDACFKECTS